MGYYALIYDCENILDVNEPDSNMIKIEHLTKDEADALTDIMTRRGVSICLIPHKE